MFEGASPSDLVGEVERCRRDESLLVARRLGAIAALLRHRTGEAEGTHTDTDDPGYALVTGFARTAAEVSAVMNVAPAESSRIVGHAEALDLRLPEVAGLLADGKIDWRDALLVINRTGAVEDALMPILDRYLAQRIEGWQCWSRRRVMNAVDAAVRLIDPKGAKERRATADTARRVDVIAQSNGMALVRGSVPASAGALFDKRLTEMATSVCTADPRTLDHRRADALSALADGRRLACLCDDENCPNRGTDGATTSRFVINVVATPETVDGNGSQPGYIDGYGIVDAEDVRELAKDATVRLVCEPSVGDDEAARYQPGAALERWLRCRDMTCRFPGCDRPAWKSDVDHTQPFDHRRPGAGGLTVAGNTKCYCRLHHRIKTFLDGPGGWRDVQLPDGTVVLTSPTGRTYRTNPVGSELFPQLRPACRRPAAQRRNRRLENAARISRRRDELHAQRGPNTETRDLNAARSHEIDLRKWRNDMRRTMLVLKGGYPSTSPWCDWVNAPLEDEDIGVDWTPQPAPPPTSIGDEPPF